MFQLIVATLVLIAAAGGWVCGRGKRRLWLVGLILLPLFIYTAAVIVIGAGDDESWRFDAAWWLIGLSYVGIPILLWAGAAGAGFSIGLLKDRAARS